MSNLYMTHHTHRKAISKLIAEPKDMAESRAMLYAGRFRAHTLHLQGVISRELWPKR